MKTDTAAVFDPLNVEEFFADRYANETAHCVYKADYDRTLALLAEAREQLKLITSRVSLTAVDNASGLTCEHKHLGQLITYKDKFCCYLCWLEEGMDEAENTLANLRERQLTSARILEHFHSACQARALLEPKADGNKKEETR